MQDGGPNPLVRGVAAGAGVAAAAIALVTLVVYLVAGSPFSPESTGALVAFLVFVGGAAVFGGWFAGRIDRSQPFAAAALVAVVLGVAAFVLVRLGAALVGGPVWLGSAIAGVAPGGAILGGLLNWAGSEE